MDVTLEKKATTEAGRITPEIRVLLIEDNPDDAFYIREMMSTERAFTFKIEHTVNLRDGIHRLSRGGIDAVLLDLGLPDSWGLETIAKLHPVSKRLPVIVLSGIGDIGTDIEAIQEGAQDYIVKDHMDRHILIRAILHAIRRLQGGDQAPPEPAREDWAATIRAFCIDVHHPLTIVKNAVATLKDGRRAQVQYHLTQVRNMVDLLHDLFRMEFDRKRMTRLWIDPAEALLNLRVSLAPQPTGRNIVLEMDAPAGLPKIFADADLLSRALRRLVGVARRFARKKIVLRVRLEDSLFSGETDSEAQTWIRFGVTHDGPATPADEIGLLFSPVIHLPWSMERLGRILKEDWLSLAVCKKIVALHEGRIWASGAVGGNEYNVALPCFDDRRHFQMMFRSALKESEQRHVPLNVLVLTVSNLDLVRSRCGERGVEDMYESLEERVASVLSIDDAMCRFKGALTVLSRANPDEIRMMLLRILERTADCTAVSPEGRVPVARRVGMAVHGVDGIHPEEIFFQAVLKSTMS